MAVSPGRQQVPWPVMSAQAMLKSASVELAAGTALGVALVSSQQTWAARSIVSPAGDDCNGCSCDGGIVGVPVLAQAAVPPVQALPGMYVQWYCFD